MMYLCLSKSHNLCIKHLKFPGISTVDDDAAAVQGKKCHMHTEKCCYFVTLSDNFNLLQHQCSSGAGSSIFQNRKVRQLILNSPAAKLGQQFLKALGSIRSPNHDVQLAIRPVLGMLISAAVQGKVYQEASVLAQTRRNVLYAQPSTNPPLCGSKHSFWKYHQIPTAILSPLQ